MNILLINPQFPGSFWSFEESLKYINKKTSFPPLGLMTVAAMLPENYEKKLVDMNTSKLKDKDIIWADMIFITAMLVQKQNAQNTINRCKKMDKKIVAGGPAFTTQYQQFENVDHLVLDEGEMTLPRFLSDFEQGQAKEIYRSEEKPDVNNAALPDWSLIKMRDYVSVSVQYSRGCPYNCEFCDIIVMNGRKPRTKAPERMMAEFDSLYKAGWRESVFIVDDNFIGNKVEVKKMLNRLIQWQKDHNYPFIFFTEASVDLAKDEELMRLMSEAGFDKVFLGIETPSLQSLTECSKHQNTKADLAESIKTLHSWGLQVMGGFIVGFDSDTAGIFDQQINFIQKTGVVTAMVGILTALPKTRLWQRLKEEKRLIFDSKGENTDGSINFIPKMGKKTLLSGYKKIITTIYSSKEYYRRVRTFLKDFNVEKHLKKTFRFTDLRPLFRSFWRIGIISSARFEYWRLLLGTLFTDLKKLPLAIEMTIYGAHFRKLAKKIAEIPV